MKRRVFLLLFLLAARFGFSSGKDFSNPNEVAEALHQQVHTNVPLTDGAWSGDIFILPYNYGYSYDIDDGNGNINIAPRQWAAQSFYQNNPDTYDFIVVFTNFDFNTHEARAFYTSIKNDVQGIGQETFDSSSFFGSSRLQGYIDAANIAGYLKPDGTLDQENLSLILNHEIGHRWLAHVQYPDFSGNPSNKLLGRDGIHWSYLLDSNASYLYGSKWSQNPDGTYTAAEIEKRYSNLDLYLMGLAPKEQVPPFTLLINPQVSAEGLPARGDTIEAEAETIHIEGVISANGSRIPDYSSSPKEFRVAFVYLLDPGTNPTPEDLASLNSIRSVWRHSFFQQTGGQAIVSPNRGVISGGGAGSPNLSAAAEWLASVQQQDGHWQDSGDTSVRETSEALQALELFGSVYAPQIDLGTSALQTLTASSTELVARQAEAILAHGGSAGAMISELQARGSGESGWGAFPRYTGDPVSTARVIRALYLSGDTVHAQAGWNWLTSVQNTDGGWGWRAGGISAVYPTLEVLHAAKFIRPGFWDLAPVQSAISWLLSKQTAGGWGEPYPGIAETSLFLQIADHQNVNPQVLQDAVDFVVSRHQADGSWAGSVYETALALRAVALSALPDPLVLSSEIYTDPESPYQDEQVTLHLALINDGADLDAGLPYVWQLIETETGIVRESFSGALPQIPGHSFISFSDARTITASGGYYTLKFVIDPDRVGLDKDRTNNTVSMPFTVNSRAAGVDLVAGSFAATPDHITSVPQQLLIQGSIINHGLMDADSVNVTVFDGPVANAVVLGTASISVSAGGSATVAVPITITEGKTYHLTIQAMPADPSVEADPSDNTAALTVPMLSGEDMAVVALAADPTDVTAGEPVTLSVTLQNSGTLPETGVQVGFFYSSGVPPAEHTIQLITIPGTIQPGQIYQTQIQWTPVAAGASIPITAVADPQEQLDDVNRGNNSASTTITVEPSTLPNLSVSPSSISVNPAKPLQGQNAHITGIVENLGSSSAGPFVIELRLDDPANGIVLASNVIDTLDTGESASIQADWLVDQQQNRVVYIVVDADNAVAEFNEQDNAAFSVIDVQSLPDLVLTTGQVQWIPSFPAQGQAIHFSIGIFNAGDQDTQNALLELLDSTGSVLESQTIASIPGRSNAVAEFDYTPADSGELIFTMRINFAQTIPELSFSNNQASVVVPVQSGDLFLSEKFFSPNGDGSKDTTTIHFRNPMTQLEINDAIGNLVRTLTDISGLSAVWDGKADSGIVVRDGSYEIRAGDVSTWVIVDNNLTTISSNPRSRLIDGTMIVNGSLVSYSVGPQEGEVFFVVQQQGHTSFTLYRHNGYDAEIIGDWPENYDAISCSGDSSICLARGSFDEYELIRYPGSMITVVAPPVSTVHSSLSPDGKWILWAVSANQVILQSTDNPGLTFNLDPCSGGDCSGYSFNPTVHWSSNSSELTIVSTPGGSCEHRPTSRKNEKGDDADPFSSIYFIVIHAGLSPSATLYTVENIAFTCVELFDTSTDFESGEISFLSGPEYRVHSLTGGALLMQIDDVPGVDLFSSSLSSNGRIVKHGDHFYDTRSADDVQIDPTFDNIDAYDWSPKDKFILGNSISENFSTSLGYLTIADNLILALRARVLFGNAGIELKMLVADRNLDRFVLEYADVAAPNQYLPIGVPSREPIYEDLWGTWIPPHKGRYVLRLTAHDLAGNVHSISKTVTWNGDNDIANLYSDVRYISPASSPGIKDEYAFHYLVLRPANLIFRILNESDVSVRSIPVAASQTGDATTFWDGKDDAGNFVNDGKYWLEFLGARWPVTVDNTPPAITFEIPPDKIVEGGGLSRKDLYVSSLIGSVADDSLDRWTLSSRHFGSENEWGTVVTSTDLLPSPTFLTRDRQSYEITFFAEKEFHFEANDLGGNTSFIERFHRDERIAFTDSEPPCRSDEHTPCIYPNRPAVEDLVDEGGLLNPLDKNGNDIPLTLDDSYNTLLIQTSIWGFSPLSLRLEYRNHSPVGDWMQGTFLVTADSDQRRIGGLSEKVWLAYWDHLNLAMRPYDVRLLAVNEDGDEIASPVRLFMPGGNGLLLEFQGTDLQGIHLRVTNQSGRLLPSVDIVTQVDHLGGSIGVLAPGDSKEWVSGCSPFLLPDSQTLIFQAIGHTSDEVEFSSQYVPYFVISLAHHLEAEFTPSNNCENSPQPTGVNIKNGALHSPGTPAAMSLLMPAEPTGSTPSSVEITLNGQVMTTAPYRANVMVNFQIDPSNLPDTPEGGAPYNFGINYRFPAGSDGLLRACSTELPFSIRRTIPSVTITSPEDGATVCTQDDDAINCPNRGFVPVSFSGNILMADGKLQWTLASNFSCTPRFVPTYEGDHQVTGITFDNIYGWWGCETIHVNTLNRMSINATPLLFSPTNTQARPTNVSFDFAPAISVPYVADVTNSGGDHVRSISGNGTAFEWDGKNDLGDLAPDGKYDVTVTLSGNCPSVSTFSIAIDKTPPSLAITRPAPNDEIGTVLEAHGIVIDPHFEKYELQIRHTGGCDDCWQTVFSSDKQHPDPSDVLGVWNTEDFLSGDYEFRIKAIDLPGNVNVVLIPITLRERQLIRRFLTNPDLISPANADGEFDESEIRYALYQNANVTLDIQNEADAVIKVLPAAGDCVNSDCVYTWDGTDQFGNAVQDGTYRAVLHAVKPDDSSVNEAELLSIIVDNTAPESDITNITEGAAYALPLPVRARIQDVHPGEYLINLIAPDNSSQALSQGSGLLNDDEIARLTALADGDYKITIHATDRALNSADIERNFTLDSTVPVAQILNPQPNAVLNTQNAAVSLDGLVRAPHLDHYEWSYAPGESPQDSDFVTIPAGIFVLSDDHSTGSWDASMLTEGVYTLRLRTFDQLGRMQQDAITFEVDNTLPQMTIQQPAQDSTIATSTQILGSVSDAHLQNWTLDVLPDGDDDPLQPVIAQGTLPVDGAIGIWNILPPDGVYSLRLTATDRAQNTAEIRVRVHVEVAVPSTPLNLSATVQNTNDVKLTWTPGEGAPPAGFNIYRDSAKINSSLLTDTQYFDLGLSTGTYAYTVRAMSAGGQESADSNIEIVTIDLSAPLALIMVPSESQIISGTVDILGSAYSELDFKEYRLSARFESGEWNLIAQRSAAVLASTLATWETAFILDGNYQLKLEAEDLDGNVGTFIVLVVVDNTPPENSPVLIQATKSAQDPDAEVNDVFIEWSYNQPPPDFAGYFLYRNGQLANAEGPVIGSQLPYLLHDTTYNDKDLPDGTYVYSATASDFAGNESVSSNNSDPVIIETRRPHAVIVQPEDGAHFSTSIDVVADSPDIDVVSLQFEYKKPADSTWTALGASLAHPPFMATLVPPSYGSFQIRAVASDAGGPDLSPIPITVVNLPQVPELSLLVDGDDVTLTWTSVADPYGTLEGYNVYRDGIRINAAPITDLSLTDENLAGGYYYYTVSSVDQEIESDPSDLQQAIIYGLAFNYLFPILDTPAANLSGSNVVRYPSTVELQRKDEDGNFNTVASSPSTDSTFRINQQALLPGMNVFHALDVDGAGNRSLPSDPFAVVYRTAPDPIEQLAFSADAGVVNLTWNGPPDQDSVGFRILRDGLLINETESPFPYDPATHTVDSSTLANLTAPLDGNPSTGWTPDSYPATWQWTWPDEIELSEIQLAWQTQPLVPERFQLDVQAQGEWLWFASVNNGGAISLTLPIGIKASGVRIRATDAFYWRNATMTEVQLKYKQRTQDLFYTDTNLAPGAYEYSITQLNRWGAISETKNIMAFVDVPAPSAPVLTVSSTANCDELLLSWQPPGSFPGELTGYRIYRSSSADGNYSNYATLDSSHLTYLDVAPTAHFYKVSALGVFNGNNLESPASNVATAEPACVTPPNPPAIEYPTTAGNPITLQSATTDISGQADDDSIVRLFRNGQEIGETSPIAGSEPLALPDYTGGPINFSANGRIAVYTTYDVNGSRIAVRNMRTNQVTYLGVTGASSFDPAISRDGSRVAYTSNKDTQDGTLDLYVYDRINTTEIRLAQPGDAYGPSFSPDGNLVVYASYDGAAGSIILADVNSNEPQVLYDANDSAHPVFSPDGSEVLASTSIGLVLIDRLTQQVQTIPGDWTYYFSGAPFSPDGNSFLYTVANPDSVSAITWKYDLQTGISSRIDAGEGENEAIYKDGHTVDLLYANPSGAWKVRERNLDSGTATDLYQNDNFLSGLIRVSGKLFVIAGEQAIRIIGSGTTFFFPDVDLQPGTNTFVVREELLSTTQDSLPIVVQRAPGALLPDAATALAAYPPFPITGESVLISGEVENTGTAPLENCTVILQRVAPGQVPITVLHTSVTLSAGASTSIQYNWNTNGVTGDFHWKLIADPAHVIPEEDESNNSTQILVPVRSSTVVEVDASTNHEVYFPGQSVDAHVRVFSNGQPTDYLVETVVQDAAGFPVEQIDSRILSHFGPGITEYDLTWSIPDIYPGDYKVHVRVSQSGIQAAADDAPFTLLPPMYISAHVNTDNTTYVAGDPVQVSGRVTNSGETLVRNLTATFRVFSSSGSVVAQEVRQIDSLPVSTTVTLSWVWLSAGMPPGNYTVHLEVMNDSGAIVADANPAAITLIQPPVSITGTMTLSISRFEPGQSLKASASVTNPGTELLQNTHIDITVVSAETLQTFGTFTSTTDLLPGQTVVFEHTFDSTGMPLGAYLVILRASGLVPQPFNLQLAQASFTLADLTPPHVLLISPSSGLVCDQALVQAQVVDVLSGVLRVFYKLDESPEELTMRPIQVPAMYAGAWSIEPNQDGPHHIVIFAQDVAGNISPPVQVDVDADSNAPTVTTDAPSDNSCVGNPVTINYSAADARLASVSATLNGLPYSSGTLISMEGVYHLVISAADKCSHVAEVVRNFRLELTFPSVEIVMPGTQGCAPVGIVPIFLASPADATLSVLLNGQPYVPGTPIVNEGDYQLVATAATACGSTSAPVTREFHVDSTPPLVAVNSPDEASCAEPGVVPDITGVEPHDLIWNITLNDQPYAIGTQILSEGDYSLIVGASDDCGNQAEPITRTFIIDDTAPQIHVSGIENNHCYSQPVTPTFDADEPHLADLAATLNGQTFVSGTTVTADGDYLLSIGAADVCSNQNNTARAFSIDATPPVITVSGIEDGGSYMGEVTPTWQIVEAHLVSSSATLNGEPVLSGVAISDPGQYTLIIQAFDCVNTSEVAIHFTINSNTVDHRPAPSTGYVLFFNNETSNEDPIELWLQQNSIAYRKVQTGCDFVSALRTGLFDQVIINDPNSAHPIRLDDCETHEECQDDERQQPASTESNLCESAGTELSSLAYGHGGVMLVGDSRGEEDCILDDLAALGAERHSPYLNSAPVSSAGGFMTVPLGMTLNNVRALDLQAGFAALLYRRAAAGGTVCSGVTAVTLKWEQPLSYSQLNVTATAYQPAVQLDSESGQLNDGESLDTQQPAWVNLRISRDAGFVTVLLSTTDFSMLPSWVRITLDAVSVEGLPVHEDLWLAPRCTLHGGEHFDKLRVMTVSKIQQHAIDYVLASGNRYGLGMGLVEPWSISDNNSAQAWDLFNQGFNAVAPDLPRSIIPGTPVPVTVTVHNPSASEQTFQVQVDLPPSTLIEAWNDPISTDPLTWIINIPAAGSMTMTYWVLVPSDGSSLPIHALVQRWNGQDWRLINEGTLQIEPTVANREQELEFAIDDIQALLDNAKPNERAHLLEALDLLDTLIGAPAATRTEAVCALTKLSQAYELIAEHQNPGELAALLRVSRLIAAWQRSWTDALPRSTAGDDAQGNLETQQ